MADDDRVAGYLKKANVELGAATLGLLTGAVGGPGAGLAVAAMTKPALERAFEEIGQALTRRRRSRASVFLDTMAQDFEEAEHVGRELRTDGFMDGGAESDFASALEHAFATAVNDVTGKKAVHLAHLMAALPYRSDIATGAALYLLDVAESMTYEEYCLVGLASTKHHLRPDDETADYLILLNMLDRTMNDYRLIGDGRRSTTQSALTLDLSPLGEQLHDLLRLDQLHPQDVDDMQRRFTARAKPWAATLDGPGTGVGETVTRDVRPHLLGEPIPDF